MHPSLDQEVLSPIQVAPVTYLSVSSQPKLYTAQGRTLSAFPLGMSLTFTVQFYNSIGEKFHTHNTQLYLALNRYGSHRSGAATGVETLPPAGQASVPKQTQKVPLVFCPWTLICFFH